MKKEINLTKEEKIGFLAELEYSNLNYGIKLNRNWTKLFASACGIGAVGAGLFAFLLAIVGGASLTFALGIFPISIGCGAGMFGICNIPAIISVFQDNKSLKSISNGKVSYRDYKQLVKSGEIEKWQKECEKEIDAKVLELQGITLEEYKRQKEDLVINDAVNTIKNQNIKLDSARISEEVKKRIDEHNERQN